MTEPSIFADAANDRIVRGSCLCGDVSFSVLGALTPIQFCHATRCRKASGAAFAPEMLCQTEQLTWSKGESAVVRYEAPLLSEPPPYVRAFCHRCGSPVPVEIPGTPFSMICAGVLDDDPGTRPFRHAFTAQKACWHELTDGLPQHPAQPPRP